MEVNKLINLNELSRRTGIKHANIWNAIRMDAPNRLLDNEDRLKIVEAIEAVSNEINEEYRKLNQFFK